MQSRLLCLITFHPEMIVRGLASSAVFCSVNKKKNRKHNALVTMRQKKREGLNSASSTNVYPKLDSRV